MSEDKVLVIGLDGASLALIEPWVREGHLPTLARLMAEGVRGQLRSVPNMNSASAWSSFATGLNPGRHGIFYFNEPVPGTYRYRYLNGGFRRGKTFWSLASEAGKRVVVINVPMSYPAEPVNGVMIAGLDTPGVESEGFTYPKSLRQELLSTVGDYIIEPGIPGYIKAGRRDLAVKRLFETIDKRLAYAKYLMNSCPWDLFVVVFTATDAAQHFFWKDMEPSHPDHDEKEAERYGRVILDVYERMDEIIQELMIQAGEATILVVSDHGGGFNQRGADYLKPWLEEMGLLHFRSSRGLRTRGRALFGKLAGGVYHLLDRNLSRETKLKLVKLLPGLREKAEESITFQGIDWGRTKAYCDGARDEIWINLRGREPEGIVEPGSEYEELQGLIIEQLERTRDLKTGERAVEGVLRRGDIYQGDQWKRAPDLYVHWRTDFVISGLSTDGRASEKMKEVARKPPLNNGGHRMEGILIIRGQPVERSRKIEEAKIIDLAPTVLYLLGVAIPQGMDGRVLLEAFRGEYITTHPLHYREVEKKGESQPSDYSAEEEKTIEERLRGMGYIP